MERKFVKDKHYDVVVIGGGITGAAIAYEAAGRGLEVALFDKGDFGAATSAATSKLIHGGLRYLKNMELGLVRESLRERKTWENIAPNLVYPIPFLIPTYQHAKDSKFMLAMGMLLYDVLSFDKKRTWDAGKALPNHQKLRREDVLKLEPQVKQEGLNGGVVYYDCQNIFPERATLAFIKSAVERGADVANYAMVTGFLHNENGHVAGVKANDLLHGQSHAVKARLVINGAGTWADKVLNLGKGQQGSHTIKRSEGIHLLTPPINNKHAVTLAIDKGQHFMIMPWRGYSLIGTTDRPYEGDPDDYSVSRESVEGLLDQVNRHYGAKTLTMNDVLYAYGGLRPLVDDQTEGVYKSSRKYEIYDNSKDGMEGLLTVEGGKYTTSRSLAEKTVDRALKKLGREMQASRSADKFLTGSEIPDMDAFMKKMRIKYKNFDPETVTYLARNYGTEAREVFRMAREQEALKEKLTDDGEILAEVRYAFEHEMAEHLDDVFLRRTGLGTLGKPDAAVQEKALQLAADVKGWDTARQKEEKQRLQNHYEQWKK